MRVVFYMRGGHIVTAPNVEKMEMTRDTSTGKYSGYSITWEDNKGPALFTLSIPDIVAVVTTK